MRDLSKSDIDKYVSLFNLIEEAFRDVQTNLGSGLQTRVSRSDLAAAWGDNRMQAYKHAKAGRTKLDEYLFASLKRFLISHKCNKALIADVTEAYEIYRDVESNFSGKKGNRATVYVSERDIPNRFQSLLNTANTTIYKIKELDHWEFYRFIDDTTELNFKENKYADCINNCYVIMRYMEQARNSEFGNLPDNLFQVRISFVARIGAWASQAIGHRYPFDKFMKCLRRAASAREPLAIISLQMAKFHESNWNKALKLGRSAPLADLIKAHDVARLVGRGNTENEIPVVYQNIAGLALNDGIHPEQKIPGIDRSVQYLLSEIKDIQILGHYDVSNRLHTLQIEALSELNKGDKGNMELAWEIVRNSWKLLRSSPAENKYSKMKLLIVEGLLTQFGTKQKENTLLTEAYKISLELGAFQYSCEIADLMGWK